MDAGSRRRAWRPQDEDKHRLDGARANLTVAPTQGGFVAGVAGTL